MYGRATRTSITVVSKFPTKTWGAAHARTVDTRRSSPQLPRAPGNEANLGIARASLDTLDHVVTQRGRLELERATSNNLIGQGLGLEQNVPTAKAASCHFDPRGGEVSP